jgi:hypothetical protein
LVLSNYIDDTIRASKAAKVFTAAYDDMSPFLDMRTQPGPGLKRLQSPPQRNLDLRLLRHRCRRNTQVM